MEQAHENQDQTTLLIFSPGKNPLWYSLLAPAAVLLMTVVFGYICRNMALDPNPLTRAMGYFTFLLFLGYVGYYYVLFLRSRGDITTRAVLTDDSIQHECPRGAQRFALTDLVFTMSYSSSTHLCILLATEREYMVLVCSCSHLFTKNGKEVLTPFYAINRFFMEYNPKHINYVKNKKYKKQNPFTLPHFLLEIDFHSKGATKFVNQLKEAHRFR